YRHRSAARSDNEDVTNAKLDVTVTTNLSPVTPRAIAPEPLKQAPVRQVRTPDRYEHHQGHPHGRVGAHRAPAGLGTAGARHAGAANVGAPRVAQEGQRR